MMFAIILLHFLFFLLHSHTLIIIAVFRCSDELVTDTNAELLML